MSLVKPAHTISTYQHRRKRLADWMRSQGGGIAVIPTGHSPLRSGHTPYPFRFDSQFYYLTGFTEPEAWLVLVATDTVTHSVLFCREKDPQTEIWEGLCWGPNAAREAFGLDEAQDIASLDTWISKHLTGKGNLFLPLSRCAIADLPAQATRWLASARQQARGKQDVPLRWIDLTTELSHHRLIKDAEEIGTMREAARIAAIGHCQAMRATRPGLTERALEAELLAVFLRAGAQSVAYETIVATGANACILHHRAGHSVIGDQDLILIDAGCELDGYASDITRTFPASGQFTGFQATLYDIVLAAQQAAIEQTRPGMTFNDGHDAAIKVLTQGLIDVGFLSGDLDGNIEQGSYQRFYMHRTGHWLGLDVHDVGPYRHIDGGNVADKEEDPPWRLLEPGMVLTIEPGLYVRPADDIDPRAWDIGIRIEDDALITPSGCELLTRDVPVDRQSIEQIMRDGGPGFTQAPGP
ncbi:aminopeptidase P N-terminal domain-containing protein [Orrella marina]|uniref:Xaa-Pro aminopeptidase n=1 Tax=Orrella marina TaxID=2163011 RepID=A0A2R4XNJ8_9BURK|nr:aminopeptidase P N-terminal domain-containing protein [Orrella marina]AWB35361.1 Xaa-Pro aminopeptidase [Orrella marina]